MARKRNRSRRTQVTNDNFTRLKLLATRLVETGVCDKDKAEEIACSIACNYALETDMMNIDNLLIEKLVRKWGLNK